LFCLSQGAVARVFDINTENFASYFRVGYGPSGLSQTPYLPSSGMNTTFDGTISTQQAYEFGFVYASRYMNMRFGIEVLKPPNQQTLKGSAADGSEWYTLNNNITVTVPKIGLEANLKQWKESRVFMAVDVGSASATIENSYKMTAAGTAQFPGVTDFREEVKSSATMLEYSIGFEMFAFDTTTILFDAGYRQLQFAAFTHNLAVTNFQGAVAKGAPALNTDGTARSAKFDGAFASIAFRFWIE